MHYIDNVPTAIEQTSFRNTHLELFIVKKKEFAMLNGDDKVIQDNDKITTYPHRADIKFIKHFKNEKISKEIEEIKKLYQKFLKEL